MEKFSLSTKSSFLQKSTKPSQNKEGGNVQTKMSFQLFDRTPEYIVDIHCAHHVNIHLYFVSLLSVFITAKLDEI